MSSYTAGNTVLPNESLQLAPVGDSGPDFDQLKISFQKTVADCQPYVAQCGVNYSSRFAIWGGQSADGKKHARGPQGQIEPVPWDGASDLRDYTIDNLINKKVALKCLALENANLVAVPVEGNDMKRAKVVSNFMRWIIKTQMPDIEREYELLVQYLEEKGAAVTGQFWETVQEKTLQPIRLSDFQQQFPDIDVQALLDSGDIDDYLKSLFTELYPITKGRAAKLLAELKKTGVANVPVVGKERSFPVMRAFNLDTDLFIPPDTTDIQQASGIYRVQYYTPEQLRSKVNTDGWDANWVEDVINTCKGKMLSVTPTDYMLPMARSFIYTQQQRLSDKVGVVWAYQRLSDEDGIPGVYLSVFSPDLPPSPSGKGDNSGPHKGYAKFTLYGDMDGAYPFVLHRREYLSRKIHDSRGLPEPLKPLQDNIKAHKDARIDTASYNIMPTLFYPLGRPPLKMGAGARVPERRPNEYHYGQPVPFDNTTEESLATLTNNARDYVGFGHIDSEQQIDPIQNQREVQKLFGSVTKAYVQIWKLYKKYGSDQIYFRVVGVQDAEATLFERGPDDEDFWFKLEYDVQSTELDKMQQKIKAMMDLAAAMDRTGAVDWTEFLQVALESMDPNIAQRVIRPADIGTMKVVNEVQDDLTKLFSGVATNLKPNTPPNIAAATVQNYFQSPDVQARYQNDPAFKERMDAYIGQVQMAVDQQNNKQIGRLGAIQPTPVINGT